MLWARSARMRGQDRTTTGLSTWANGTGGGAPAVSSGNKSRWKRKQADLTLLLPVLARMAPQQTVWSVHSTADVRNKQNKIIYFYGGRMKFRFEERIMINIQNGSTAIDNTFYGNLIVISGMTIRLIVATSRPTGVQAKKVDLHTWRDVVRHIRFKKHVLRWSLISHLLSAFCSPLQRMIE